VNRGQQVVCVAGTHDWCSDDTPRWYKPGSPFMQILERRGFRPFFASGRPFAWSSSLDGVRGKNSIWEATGFNLFWYCVPPLAPERCIPPCELMVITHSHGLQPALYAASFGLKIDRLISVTGPVRKDMLHVAAQARPNIRYWRHVWTRGDWWQLAGGLFDRQLGAMRKHPLADDNVMIPGIGHSGLFRDARHLPSWEWLI
jgi:hypothetical protein